MQIKLNLIAAACENMGIGKNNDLPWKLKSEMKYFQKMTTNTIDKSKKNVVLMGRRTWDSIPPKYKPLNGRINFILSRSDLNVSDYEDCYSFKSLDEVVDRLKSESFKNRYENVWVIGGSHIYREAMNSRYFFRLYMTEIKAKFDCDTFFPKLPNSLKEIIDDLNVPSGVQEENGITFVCKVYENENYQN